MTRTKYMIEEHVTWTGASLPAWPLSTPTLLVDADPRPAAIISGRIHCLAYAGTFRIWLGPAGGERLLYRYDHDGATEAIIDLWDALGVSSPAKQYLPIPAGWRLLVEKTASNPAAVLFAFEGGFLRPDAPPVIGFASMSGTGYDAEPTQLLPPDGAACVSHLFLAFDSPVLGGAPGRSCIISLREDGTGTPHPIAFGLGEIGKTVEAISTWLPAGQAANFLYKPSGQALCIEAVTTTNSNCIGLGTAAE